MRKCLALLMVFMTYFPVLSFSMEVHDGILQFQMIAEFAKDIEAINGVKNQLNDAINNTKNQLNNALTVPYSGLQTFNIKQDLQNLADKLKKDSEYAYQAANDVETKNSLFAGYKMPDGKSYKDQYADIANNLQNLLNNVLASMQNNAEHFDKDSQNLQDMQSQAHAAQTQMQIAQSAAQIAAEGVNQMQLLRQTMIAQTNAQTAYYAAQNQKEASAKADMSKIIQAGSSDITGKLDEYPLDLPKL